MKGFKEDIDNTLDDAYKLGNGDSSVAAAYYLEAIAKMMYVQMFHEQYARDYDSESSAGHIAEEEQDEISESINI